MYSSILSDKSRQVSRAGTDLGADGNIGELQHVLRGERKKDLTGSRTNL
jgi:hypothetical protein